MNTGRSEKGFYATTSALSTWAPLVDSSGGNVHFRVRYREGLQSSLLVSPRCWGGTVCPSLCLPGLSVVRWPASSVHVFLLWQQMVSLHGTSFFREFLLAFSTQ